MTELRIQNASKRYGSTLALNEVSLVVPSGSRMAIVGPSGSGKTSLLRLIAGFETPDSGLIEMGGNTLCDGGTFVPPHRRDVGYVAQEGALFPHMSVADNVGFGITRTPGRTERIVELLQQVGIPADMMTRRPHQLSGGQQQRVALARAMARSPSIMLLDEPFSALDAGLRDAVRDMVGAVLGAAGITTILVTHDQAEALSFADYVAVMRDGRLVQTGSPQDLYLHPADPQTARFLGDAIILRAVVTDGIAHTLLGQVAVAAKSGPQTIMLRPEQIRIRPADPSPSTRGRVVSRRYEGAAWRTVIEHVPTKAGRDDFVLETASVFVAWVPGSDAFPPGTEVSIDLVGSAHVFGKN
ncbi:ATP-binding cassette domain-containing protein [Devosia sp. D6-9]|nr:ATP-binding cassette domain-containing protein [Devosia sp. D6-9]